MITAQSIFDNLRSKLDAEGSDYYRDDVDLIPATNSAVKWLVSVINAAYAQRKVTEEIFVDLAKVRVYQPNSFSRVQLPLDLWTILGVFTQIVTHPASPTLHSLAASVSEERGDISFISSLKSASRLTIEEWNQSTKNPFKAGNSIQTISELIEYAYLAAFDFSSDDYTGLKEITIKPSCANSFIAIAMAMNPTDITSAADNVEFPEQARMLIEEKALQYIAYKQGDQTNLFTVTERDIMNLSNIMR